MANVIKTTVFIKDMGEFTKINEIYARKGYDFTGTAYENYFSQKSWYAPVKGKIVQESEINQYEKENIDLLVKLEKNYK